ncbi:RNA-dependent RNA polymerase [Mycena indigotica]|uniref:RNA-dependent RNA polymerase n=1 Tax=Mycena indigotica TaxID=2126181 RepID=A0A8H6SAR7_9AGAR|nr:RNA-dependent RNA polymerase [Mycena indigotica]KAF7295478.1 RNA-dependent RNA polymerase [Mycena indigotica]
MSEFDYDNDLDGCGPEFWEEYEVEVEKSPRKKTPERYRVARTDTPTIDPSHDRILRNDESPTKLATPRTEVALSQPMEGIELSSEEEEDEATFKRPIPAPDFGPVKPRGSHSDLEVGNALRKSGTVSSLDSVDSFFFENLSRKTSATSLSSAGNSPRKRAADIQAVSPSPSKSRKLDEAEPAFIPKSILGEHGTSLQEHVIFHDDDLQQLFDSVGVPLGTQWEIVRELLTSRPRWTIQDLKQLAQDRTKRTTLHGSNLDTAPHLRQLLGKGKSKRPNKKAVELWSELDREQKALLERRGGGLGLLDGDKWHGGQVTFHLRLRKLDSGDYKIVLEKPTKGRSYRFLRILGSTGLLHLSIPNQLVRDEPAQLRAFLSQRFILNGRVYVALPVKDATAVYLFQTDINWLREPLPYFGDDQRMSLLEFMRRHNPIEYNADQAFAKYLSRYGLGFSTSKPVLEFKPENIMYISDRFADGHDPNQKASSEQIMTDGCGFLNRAAALAIKEAVGYDKMPTMVQGRIGGAKGTWLLHPTDVDVGNEPKIWIRESQCKIKYHPDEGETREHRIFDLLKVSHPPQTDSRFELSEQSVLCLSADGVPTETIVKLLVDGLTESVAPLLQWNKDDESGLGDMVQLWRAVDKLGSVVNSRAQRVAGSQSRVLGLRDREVESPENEEEDEMEVDGESRAGLDEAGGALGLHERVVQLLQAGFHPRHCAYLNDKLKFVGKMEINSASEKHRISLPESTGASSFAGTDPTGLLKPRQVYFESSKPFRDPKTQVQFTVLTGPVLIGRYPIRTSSDMQLVTAVDIPQLHGFTDVMLASIHGERSLLSDLSGGDYDGDTVIMCWAAELLEKFENKPLVQPPPNFVEQYFEKDVKTGKSFFDELASLSPEEAQKRYQEESLMGIHDTMVGLYSTFHDNAVLQFGYDHPNAILMAHMGNTLLDAAKSGLRLRPGVFEKHRAQFGGKPKEVRKDEICSQMSAAAKAKGDQFLLEFEKLSGTHNTAYAGFKRDKALLEPYQVAKRQAETNDPELPLFPMYLKKAIAQVDAAYEHYKKTASVKSDPCGEEDKAGQKKLRTAIVSAAYSIYSQPLNCRSLGDEKAQERIKASYAYSKSEWFAFEIAFATLCGIKADSMPGGSISIMSAFDEAKTISGAAARALQED